MFKAFPGDRQIPTTYPFPRPGRFNIGFHFAGKEDFTIANGFDWNASIDPKDWWYYIQESDIRMLCDGNGKIFNSKGQIVNAPSWLLDALSCNIPLEFQLW
jgi:hypothetical protein